MNARRDAGTGLADIPYSEPGYWKNVGTGDVIKATWDGGPIVVSSENGSSSAKWTFETP